MTDASESGATWFTAGYDGGGYGGSGKPESTPNWK